MSKERTTHHDVGLDLGVPFERHAIRGLEKRLQILRLDVGLVLVSGRWQRRQVCLFMFILLIS